MSSGPLKPERYRRSLLTLLLAAGGLCTLSGCLVTTVKWRAPCYARPNVLACLHNDPTTNDAEDLYAVATQLERDDCETCVDFYFRTAMATSCGSPGGIHPSRRRRLHDSALNKLVVTGQKFGRLDPRGSLRVQHQGQSILVPVTHQGFVWQPSDFHHLATVGHYKTNAIKTVHRRTGLGVPLVVTHCNGSTEGFLREENTFAATLHLGLRHGCDPVASIADPSQWRLQLSDPFRVDHAAGGSGPEVIAKDISAPLVYLRRDVTQTILANFINPDANTGEEALFMLEPFQPTKTPVVFVHGLLSDPFTWMEMVNELRARPEFVHNYQAWVFRYPTGSSFLFSGAKLREQLAEIARRYDPQGSNHRMRNMVLVGHSMGGLVSKLQVTSSRDLLWRSVARAPFASVQMDAQLRERIAQSFFFEPSPQVSRVIYLATPHRGANTARRAAGRLGSLLVSPASDSEQQYNDLIAMNPGVFTDEVNRRIPTSIDMLEPSSCLLQALASLPQDCRVQTHSVIGVKRGKLLHRPSDGVVPAESAEEPRAVSELRVNAVHTEVHKHPDSIEEVLGILLTHLGHREVTRGQMAAFRAARPAQESSDGFTNAR